MICDDNITIGMFLLLHCLLLTKAKSSLLY